MEGRSFVSESIAAERGIFKWQRFETFNKNWRPDVPEYVFTVSFVTSQTKTYPGFFLAVIYLWGHNL